MRTRRFLVPRGSVGAVHAYPETARAHSPIFISLLGHNTCGYLDEDTVAGRWE